MEAEPVSGGTASIPKPTNPSRPDGREAIIQSCYELLCSGQALSEVLEKAKRLSDLSKATKFDAAGEPSGQISDAPDEARSHSSARSEPENTQLPELTPSRLVDHSRGSSGALTPYTGSNAAHNPDALSIQQPPGTIRVEQGWATKLSRLTGPALYWLIPTMSLIVTATIGGPLVVAYLPTAAEATPVLTMIAGALRPAKDPPASPTAEAELTTVSAPSSESGSAAPQLIAETELTTPSAPSPEPGSAAPQATADAELTIASAPSSEPSSAAPQATAEAELTTASTPSPDRGSAEPQMTAEEIKALLARGDALLSMADVTSSRLFYERAVAAGDAQAALRLAATCHPSFLAQAGFKGVGGALAAAHYWYQRARDLGSDADIASFGHQLESARAAEQVVTVSPAEPVTEPGTTGQARIQSTDRGSQNVMTGDPTHQASLGVHRRVTGAPRPAQGRHTRIQPPPNGQRCPHSGNCLTPP
jgi:hypothetical protein